MLIAKTMSKKRKERKLLVKNKTNKQKKQTQN